MHNRVPAGCCVAHVLASYVGMSGFAGRRCGGGLGFRGQLLSRHSLLGELSWHSLVSNPGWHPPCCCHETAKAEVGANLTLDDFANAEKSKLSSPLRMAESQAGQEALCR